MGDRDTISKVAEEAQMLAQLEAEFNRELERNAAALLLLKERAEEAHHAKSRYYVIVSTFYFKPLKYEYGCFFKCQG